MQVDYLIVGQGICGTMLSWNLYREGKSFLVIDNHHSNAASKVAAGIINPVTGRRYSYSWMIDEIMPFAVEAYKEMGSYFNTSLVFQKSVIDFFPSPQMRQAFIERMDENDTYLHSYPDQNHFNRFFHYDFGCGEIRPAYVVHLQLVLEHWRKKLLEQNLLIEADLHADLLQVSKDRIAYQQITAGSVIFCEGSFGASNPWFRMLPYAPNKGEALVIHCEGLSNQHIFKKGFLLAPLPQPGHYWIGSNYQWEFADDRPTEQFLQQATTLLNGWLKQPYSVVEHKAAIRPATLERRPFVGFHPQEPRVGILNGMGTKGTSLAPFFAYQLVQHLVYGLPISPEADVKRFSRILSK